MTRTGKVAAVHSGDSRSPRAEVAAEAARLLAESGYRDFAAAKSKAAQRLAGGGSGRSAMPTNLEVAVALQCYLQTFDAEGTQKRLRERRELAVQLMRYLSEFQPRAAGALVSGLMSETMPVEIHLFSDPPERVDMFLGDAGWEFDDDEKRLRHPAGREVAVPVCRTETPEGIAVELLVFETQDMRWSPSSPIDGKPMLRLDQAAMQKVLAQQTLSA